MKILIERRGAKDYVYLYTSRRVARKDTPAVIKRYVGILDPDTGLVAPKKVPPEEFLTHIHDGEFTCAELGNVLMARKAAESLRLGETLQNRFGDRSDMLLAIILTMAMDPVHAMRFMESMPRYYLDDLLHKKRVVRTDVDRALVALQDKSTSISALDRDERRYIFVLWDSPDLHGADIHHESPRRISFEGMVFLVTDVEGNPLIVRSLGARMDHVESLRMAVQHAEMSGRDNILALGEGITLETMSSLTLHNTRFVSEADSLLDIPEVYSLCVDAPADGWSEVTENGRPIYMRETYIDMAIDSTGWHLSGTNEMGERRGKVRMKAIVWYDPNDYETVKTELNERVRLRRRILESIDGESANEILGDGSIESRFITLNRGPDGVPSTSIRRKELRQAAIRSSVHLFITNREGWEECMKCSKLRRVMELHAGPIIEAAGNPKDRFRYGYGTLALLAMKVRMQLERMLSESGYEGMSADDAFRIASSYHVVRVNGHVYRSSITREAKKLFDALNVELDHRNGHRCAMNDANIRGGADPPGPCRPSHEVWVGSSLLPEYRRDVRERVLRDVQDDGGVGLPDVLYRVDLLDDLGELVPVDTRDPDYAVALSRDIEHGDHLRDLRDLVLHGLYVVRIDADEPHVLVTERHVVDARAISVDDALGLEVLDPLYECGRVHIELLRELPVGALAGPAQELDYTFVQFVEV